MVEDTVLSTVRQPNDALDDGTNSEPINEMHFGGLRLVFRRGNVYSSAMQYPHPLMGGGLAIYRGTSFLHVLYNTHKRKLWLFSMPFTV